MGWWGRGRWELDVHLIISVPEFSYIPYPKHTFFFIWPYVIWSSLFIANENLVRLNDL